jgi:hypothetical protein
MRIEIDMHILRQLLLAYLTTLFQLFGLCSHEFYGKMIMNSEYISIRKWPWSV